MTTIQEHKRTAEKLGLEVLAAEQCARNSTHYKMRVRRSDGEEAFFVVTTSATDRRADKNSDARLRRFATTDWTPRRDR